MIKRILSYVGNNAWALDERTFQMWQGLFLTKLQSGDISDIHLYSEDSKAEQGGKDTEKAGNVAVIPIHGTLMGRNSVFSSARTYPSIKADIQEALDDDSFDRIVLDIDSPGGGVSGLYQLGDFIKQAKQIKPIDAYTDGVTASAAYWIASCADRIFASPTSDIGSIGVLSMHVDMSKADEMEGIKRTYIYSGKFKAMGNVAEPLTAEAKKYMQNLLDKAYSVFLEEVSENRGLSLSDYENWAEGKIFIAEEAQKLELIDGIGTLDTLLNSETQVSDSKVASAPSSLEGIETYKDLTEENMTFDPKKYEGDAAFQQYMEGIKSQAVAESDQQVKKLEQQLASAQGNSKEMEARVQKLEATLEKQEALRKEATLKARADGIFNEMVAETSVPENLHDKARKMLNHNEHVAEGVLNDETWRKAVSDELKDWASVYEDKSLVLGSSTSTKSAGGSGSVDPSVYDKEADTLMEMMGLNQNPAQ